MAKRFPTGPTAGDERTEARVQPFRAFLISLSCGLALLFSARGLVQAMQPAPDQRIGNGPIEVPTA